MGRLRRVELRSLDETREGRYWECQLNTGCVDEVQKGKDVDTGHYLELDSGGLPLV
jgi:hypothetical protein